MATIVDARGQACPQPVILTRNALQEASDIITIVDNETSQHNVTKMAQKSGAIVRVETQEDGIYLHIRQDGELHEKQALPTVHAPIAGPLVLFLGDDLMGRGDPELGNILIRGFLHTLNEVEPLPDAIILVNNGVKLAVEGSKVLDDLRVLAGKGVEILSCGTCLGHYELTEKLGIGEISNMYTIAETLLNAGKVVRI